MFDYILKDRKWGEVIFIAGLLKSKYFTYTYPAKTLRRVVFPAPLEPNIAIKFPDKNSPLTEWSTFLKPDGTKYIIKYFFTNTAKKLKLAKWRQNKAEV